MQNWMQSLVVGATVFSVSNAMAVTIRVDPNSPTNGIGDLADWSNARHSLQSALGAAASGDVILVADGTYKPTTGTSRFATFSLVDNVRMFGGHAGYGAANPDLRGFVTILSGDINTTSVDTDNSYTVVTVPFLFDDPDNLVDGFTITKGYDDNTGSGGGINAEGRATFRDCKIVDNHADNEGGGFSGASFSNITFRICEIKDNTATNNGGGLSTTGTIRILNCDVLDNAADFSGGGLYIADAVDTTIVASTFKGNSTDGFGGGISVTGGSDPTPLPLEITNCLIVANTADAGGGVAISKSVNGTITNTTFSDNEAASAGGAWYHHTDSGSCAIVNAIFWDDVAAISPEIYVVSGTLTVTYSDVEGGYTGTGNINSNPNFDANYRLQCDSPCVNTASDAATVADSEDANENSNTTEKIDKDFGPRIITQVDMGAFEKPGQSGCADANGNGVVNVDDLLAVINAWGNCANPSICPADMAPAPCGNDVVNVDDLLLVVNTWGVTCATGETSDVGSLSSVEDCMDAASLEFTPYSEAWDNAVAKCVDALCAAEIIDCD